MRIPPGTCMEMAHPAKGCLLCSHHGAVEEAHDDMDGADGVGEGEVVEDALVEEVEAHVQAIPHQHEQQCGQLRRCLHAHHLGQGTADRDTACSATSELYDAASRSHSICRRWCCFTVA